MRGSSLLIVISSLAGGSLAYGLDPVNNFCRRWYHQSAVKNDMLYISGGSATFSDRGSYDLGTTPNWTGYITEGPNNYIVSVNLTDSWNWKTNISETAINITAASATGTDPPIVERGALYHGPTSDSKVYLYGGITPDVNTSFPGYQSPTSSQYSLWGFDTDSHDWTQYDITANAPVRPSYGAHTEIPEKGLAFYFNGLINNMSAINVNWISSTEMIEGLVVLDLNTQTATNLSTSLVDESGSIVRGEMIYVDDFGTDGVIVHIGGATYESDVLSLVSMDSVRIFDVSFLNSTSSTTDGWVTQDISGTVPDARVDFCLALNTAPDQSSINVIMYGGWDPNSGTAYDELWILSIPSFTWTLVNSGASPRYGHTCHIVGAGKSQLLTVGGLDNSYAKDSCDWEWEGVAIMDMSTITWGSIYNANDADYTVPRVIYNVVGGDEDGNATVLLPSGGWSTVQLAEIFTGTSNQTANAVISSKTTGNEASSGSATPASSSTTSSSSTASQTSSTGAIVGGVVGGVGGAALVALIALALLRRKRKQSLQSKKESHGDEVSGEPPMYETTGQSSRFEADGTQIYEADKGHPAHEAHGVPISELP